MMSRAREPVALRIKRMTIPRGECLLWRGSKTRDGYGVLVIGRKQFRAHRASFEAFVGPIPDGALVCHSCDTPLCVNPHHLFLGSPKDNIQDAMSKGRMRQLTDSEHPNTKVSHSDRRIIRLARKSGESLVTIAARYGVAFQTISDICRGRGTYGAR